MEDHTEVLKTMTSHLSSASICVMNTQVGNIWYLHFSNGLDSGLSLIPNAAIPSLLEILGLYNQRSALDLPMPGSRSISRARCPLPRFPFSFPELYIPQHVHCICYFCLYHSLPCPQLPLTELCLQKFHEAYLTSLT